MAESKFINPLFQRTDAARPPERFDRDQERPQVTTPQVVASRAPVKFTFYFLPEQLQRLDDLWVRTKLEHRERLNKSEFLRLALGRLMDEFDRDPKGVLAELRRQRPAGR